jgi:hypothetical protein
MIACQYYKHTAYTAQKKNNASRQPFGHFSTLTGYLIYLGDKGAIWATQIDELWDGKCERDLVSGVYRK